MTRFFRTGTKGTSAIPPAIALPMSPHFRTPEFLPLPNNCTSADAKYSFSAVDDARFGLIIEYRGVEQW